MTVQEATVETTATDAADKNLTVAVNIAALVAEQTKLAQRRARHEVALAEAALSAAKIQQASVESNTQHITATITEALEDAHYYNTATHNAPSKEAAHTAADKVFTATDKIVQAHHRLTNI